MMILAARCLGQRRRQWALAMHAEFDEAVAEDRALEFAAGCLIAACRDMPAHAEGRIAMTNHALALGLLVPMAAIQFLWAGGAIDHAVSQNPYLGGAQLAAAPSLLLLWLILGSAHLRLAWVMLDQDWTRVFDMGAMIVAGTATLAIYMGVLFLDDARLIVHAAVTAAELAIVAAVAGWHRRVGAFAQTDQSI